jgi:hypothetical protein
MGRRRFRGLPGVLGLPGLLRLGWLPTTLLLQLLQVAHGTGEGALQARAQRGSLPEQYKLSFE